MSSVDLIGPTSTISVEILGARGPEGPPATGAGGANVNGIAYAAGPLMPGQVVIASTSSATVYDFLDINYTTGVLPGDRVALATTSSAGAISGSYKASLDALIAGGGVSDATTSSKGIVQLAGDFGGTAASPRALKVNGVSYPSLASTVGTLAIVSAAGVVSYAALDIANAASVSGVLAATNQAPQALTGDVVGTTAANTLTLAGDVTGRAGATVTGKVNGISYAAGPLTVGTVPRATASGATAYGALDLANASAVTGTLPGASVQLAGASNQGVISAAYKTQVDALIAGGPVADATTSSKGVVQLAGDWGGTAASPLNLRVNGVAFSSVASTVGQLAIVTAVGVVNYAALNLATAASVTGLLAAANQSPQTMGGDVAGTTAASTVTLAGDVTGRAGVTVVGKVNGASYPAAGAFVTGTIPRATGPSAVAMGALDLANTNATTGVLASSSQAAQTLTGDVLGTTAANTLTLAGDVTGRAGVTVVGKVQGVTYPSPGAFVVGTSLRATGASTLALGAVDLANTSAVTGLLAAANQSAQAMGGDVAGTTAASTVTLAGDATGRIGSVVVGKINGATVPVAGSLTTGHLAMVSGLSALAYGLLANANVSATAAIAGSKIAPDFGAQNIVTTGSGTFASLRATGLSTGIGHSDASGNLSSSLLVNADVAAAAAILGTKISPDFGSQNIITTGALSIGATPSTVGNVRLPFTGSLQFRNSGNSGNVTGISYNAGSELVIGDANAAGINIGNNNVYVGWQYGSPTFAHQGMVYDGATSSMTMRGQSAFGTATGTNRNAGYLQFQGGARTDTNGRRGGVRLGINGTSEYMFETGDVQAEVTSPSRVMACLFGGIITTTQMPTGTGDKVMPIANCAVAPTVAPTGCAVVYVNGGDVYRATTGSVFQSLGNSLATRTWPSDANYTAVAADYSATIIHLSGATLTATRNFVVPIAAGYRWTISNATGGAQSIQVIGASGTGITIATGKRAEVYADGTNIVRLTPDA